MQFHRITRQLAVDVPDVRDLVPAPPEPWIVRGPRGGHYLAMGPVECRVGETADDFIRDTVTVMYRSARARYLRPEQARRMGAS